MRNCSLLQLKIAPEQIHFLKFILEGYDNLAIQSTLDPEKGIVLLRFPPEMKTLVTLILKDLKPIISSENIKIS